MPESLSEDAARASDPKHARLEPRWVRALALGSASAVAAFGAVGLALAVAGVYHAVLVFALGAVAWIALLWLARPILAAPGATDTGAHVAGGLAVAFVGAIVFWHARHASQHVLINRDGGAYANAGRWIAEHGNLRPLPAVGPFAHQSSLVFSQFGLYQNRDGSLSFQFAHLLPALLAEAERIGGDRLMFATPALLAGAALLALFVAAWRLLRNPYVAVAAVVAFAFVLPEVSFSRDTYSEIPTQVLLFTALWIFSDRGALQRWRVALVAGLLLGTLQGIRIDALAAMLGVPVLFAIAWVRADDADRRSVGLAALACAAGVVPGLVLGFTDVVLRSHQYFHDLRGDVKHLIAAMIASVVLSVIGALVARRVNLSWTREAWVADAAAAFVVVAGLAAWFIRPYVQKTHAGLNGLVSGLQAAAGVKVDGTRRYFERSMQWMSWYLGPVAVAVAIVAAALLVRAILRGRQRTALALVMVLGPASALYLWSASAFPDQIWVMRRFLISALPLLTLLVFGMVAGLLRWVPARVPRAVPVVAALVIGAFAVGYPISTVVHLRNITEQRGDLLIVKDACAAAGGSNGAIVVLHSRTGLLDQWLPQALRDWCNVPVATMPDNSHETATLEQLAASWKVQKRQLWVVADNIQTVMRVLPSVTPTKTPVAINPFFLERTLIDRPTHYVAVAFSVVLARVPTG